MAKKLRSLDDAPLDVFESVKRAFMKRGYVRRIDGHTKPRKQSEPSNETTPSPEPSAMNSPDEDPERLIDITSNAQEILFQAHTIFPFNLFPDTITIDREKITIANRFFFRVAKINSTPIADLQSVEADVGPFFGSLKVTSKYFINNTRELTFLSRADVVCVQRLLQGYIIATQRDIDCNAVDTDQLKTLLLDLGQGVTD